MEPVAMQSQSERNPESNPPEVEAHISKVIYKLIAVLLICSGAAAWGQSPQKPPVLIKAGHLFEARSGRMLTAQAILIEGDRIKEVGDSATLARHAPSAKVIDLSSATVLPGLIDCHAHVLGNLKDYSPTRTLRTSSPQGVLWGLHNLQTWLDHGFTALRDAGEDDQAYGQLALRDSINQGLIRGPRMVSAGNFISITGGHGDPDPLAPDQALPRRPNLADNVDEVGVAVRHDLKYGVDWIKLMATGGVEDVLSDFNVQELSEEQMAKAVEIAHRARKKVMAHAEGTEGIKAAVRAGVDSVEHGTMLDEEGAALLAQKGTWLVPTLEVFQRLPEIDASSGHDPLSREKSRAILKFQSAAFRWALQNHVKIAFGLDDDPDFLDREFSALVSGGMKPVEALQAATVNAADLLGLSDQIGSIEPGKFADVIAVSGDPLADITKMEYVVFVMKGGEIIKNTK
jgi:imidazolonepropionase-like amidohydrolase